MDRRLQLDQPAILCRLREIKARLAPAGIELPDITLPVHPHRHRSAALSPLKEINTTPTLVQSELLSQRTLTDLMRDSSSAAAMVAVAAISLQTPPAPHYLGLKVQLPIRRMLAAVEQAFSVLQDDPAVDTALTQRPTLNRTSTGTIRCRT